MSETDRKSAIWKWYLARGILFASGVSLFVYIGYRYMIGSVPDHGSLYGVLFPLSSLLAAGALAMAVSPHLLDRVTGLAEPVVRGGIVLVGAGWLATGLLCLRSLVQGVMASPIPGGLDLVHMLSHHVVIPAGLGLLAWNSGKVEGWLGGAPRTSIADLGVAADGGHVEGAGPVTEPGSRGGWSDDR